MKKFIFYSFLFVFSLVAGCAPYVTPPNVKSTVSPGFNNVKYKKIAVYVNKNRKNNFRSIEEEFIKALIGKNYTVPARSDLSTIIKEQDFQNSDISDSTAAELGKLIDVQAILIVSVNYVEKYDSMLRKNVKHCEISARMIDVENGEILWIGKSTSGPYDFVKARYLAKSVPPSESLQSVAKDDYGWNHDLDGKYDTSFNWKGIDKIIVQIKGLENNKEDNYLFENEIIAKLMENGYRVPSRSDLDAIFKEHDFNINMLSDEAMTQIGKLSNTNAMMIVWVGPLERLGRYVSQDKKSVSYNYGTSSTVRIIDLENSKVVWSGTYFYSEWKDRHENEREIYQKISRGLAVSGLIPKKGSFQELASK